MGKVSQNNFSWKLQDGKTVLFWEDKWLDSDPLKDIFKRIYKLSNLKGLNVFSGLEARLEGQGLLNSSNWSRSLLGDGRCHEG